MDAECARPSDKHPLHMHDRQPGVGDGSDPGCPAAAVLKPGAGYTGILLTQGVRVGYTGGFTATNLTTNRSDGATWPDFCYSGHHDGGWRRVRGS